MKALRWPALALLLSTAALLVSSQPLCGQVFSQNVVGYMSLGTVTGSVVQLRKPGDFSTLQEQKVPVVLTEVFLTGDMGTSSAKGDMLHEWLWSGQGIGIGGSVGDAVVDGIHIELLNKNLTAGCLATKEFGPVPVGFKTSNKGIAGVKSCALIFSDEQLARLRRQAGTPGK